MEGRRLSLSSVDVSLSIPPTAPATSMLVDRDNMSDDKISIIIPHRSPATPHNKIIPLGFQQDEDDDPPQVLSAKSMTLALIKKVVAEFLGTFMLVFTVVSALIMNETHNGALGLLGIAVTAGLAIVVIVSSIFHVSGAQLNPAVAITMAVFGHMPRAHLVPYIVAQLLGSTAASFVAKALYNPVNLGAIITTVPTIGTFEAFWIEFITTFVLLFVITALTTDPRAVKEQVALGAAAAVMLSALVSGESTGASMNPARTLGTAIATGTYTKIWIYIVAPPLGAIAGCGSYHALK